MSFVRDATCLAGASLMLFGIYRVYEPLSYVAGGVMLCGLAVLWSMKANKR